MVLGIVVLTKIRGSFAAGHPCFVEHSRLCSFHMYCDCKNQIVLKHVEFSMFLTMGILLLIEGFVVTWEAQR